MNESLLARLDASRVLAVTGLLLVILSMILGEVYAIYISHVANAAIRQNWYGVIESTIGKDPAAISGYFSAIYDLAEKRGRFMNTHSHMSAFGLLALGLAVLQPLLNSTPGRKRCIAWLFITGAVLQFGSVYISYYVGPWILNLADLGGILVCVALAATLYLFLQGANNRSKSVAKLSRELIQSQASRFLLRAGLLLILLGLLSGLLYSWFLVMHDEPGMHQAMNAAVTSSAQGDLAAAKAAIIDFKRLQSKIAITAAAHSHAVNFGFIMLLLAFLQSYVLFSESWRMRWAWLLVTGGFLLPVCVFLATRHGLKAAAFADLFGALAMIGLFAMGVGIIRHTGAVDMRESGMKES